MLVPLMIALAVQAVPADTGIESYAGTARADAQSRVLYREQHYRYKRDGQRRELVLYLCPDGRPFARKSITGAESLDPDFALMDQRTGYREGVRTDFGKRTVYVHGTGASSEQSSPLPNPDNAVIDSGFDVFVRKNWAALMAGDRLTMSFLVPSRMAFMTFRVFRIRHAEADKQGIRVFRLRLDRWLGAVLPHIDVGYDSQNRQLRWYRGLSNLRDADGDNVEVGLRYPPTERHSDVDPEQLRQAGTSPLDGRCKL